MNNYNSSSSIRSGCFMFHHSPKNKSSQPVTYEINASTTYKVSQSNFTKRKGALIERGANGSLAGSDVRVISQMNLM